VTQSHKMQELIRQALPAEIEAECIELISAQAQVSQIPAGQRLFATGQACGQFVLLLKGQVQVELTSKTGRNVELFTITSGQSCALTNACLLTDSAYYAQGIAISDVTLISMDGRLMTQLLDRSHVFARMILQDYSQRIGTLTSQIDRLINKDLDRELWEYLNDEQIDGVVQRSHDQIAQRLGTAREVISRKLKALERDGAVALSRSRIELVGRARPESKQFQNC